MKYVKKIVVYKMDAFVLIRRKYGKINSDTRENKYIHQFNHLHITRITENHKKCIVVNFMKNYKQSFRLL